MQNYLKDTKEKANKVVIVMTGFYNVSFVCCTCIVRFENCLV